MSSTKRAERADPERLSDKGEIKRLVAEALRALRQTTYTMVAESIGMLPGALSQAMRRGNLAGRHVRALREVIETGKPVARALKSDELNALRQSLEESYASLGLRGRAQFTVDFTTWLDARMPILRRLDRHVRVIEGHAKS